MFELVFLGLASWFIPIYFGTKSLIIPIAVGLIIGLFVGGSLGRLLGSIFALLISVIPAGVYAISNNWSIIFSAVIFGGLLFLGYLAGTILLLVFTPFRIIKSIFKKVR